MQALSRAPVPELRQTLATIKLPFRVFVRGYGTTTRLLMTGLTKEQAVTLVDYLASHGWANCLGRPIAASDLDSSTEGRYFCSVYKVYQVVRRKGA